MIRLKEYIRDGRAPIPEKEVTSQIMSSIKDRNTRPELILRKVLWHNGVKGYRKHWKKVPGRPDIAFPGKKLAVFVNGCFWHRCPFCNPPMPKSHSDFWNNKFRNNIERDQKKIDLLKEIGWETLTVWECQLKNNNIIHVDKIKAILNET
jgi:DNA mismatch endonuclease, patch repair protein